MTDLRKGYIMCENDKKNIEEENGKRKVAIAFPDQIKKNLSPKMIKIN